MPPGQPLRMVCKAHPDLNAAVRGDEVVLVRADPSDKYQDWIQDYDNVGRVTDQQGRRAFALVNVATGKALVHHREELQLDGYTGHDRVEISKLWSLGVQFDDGFCEIRNVTDTTSTINVQERRRKEPKVGLFRYSRKTEGIYDYTVWKIVPITSESDP
ncbi:unnamed protein product [Urochloa decumbens]|uniref:Uncharacterized protein n=1 Tax=Urochloa decumbens TaxID=240449 RepID=A0ABC8WT98_9POAL